MRILIDTNILINLEDNKVLQEEFSSFYKQAIHNKCDVLYHKACIEDILRDKNEGRRKVILSKLNKYQILENPASLDPNFSTTIGEKKVNDRIDNVQLLQVKKEYVELLVTNDKGILKKAKKLKIEDRVLNSNQAKLYLDKKYTLVIPEHPVLNHESIRNLEKDFNSIFFESLKKDYGSEKFMNWIKGCAKADRKCYNLRVDSKLSALLIYKIEEPKDHNLSDIQENAIKICTLKVGDDALGLKLGELFLNNMFKLCLEMKLNFLYVTTYDKQTDLIRLIEKIGFESQGKFQNSIGQIENTFLKKLSKTSQLGKNGSEIHPFFCNSERKYIICLSVYFPHRI